MNIRKLFSLEKGGVIRRSIGALRFRLPHSTLLSASLLLLILLIAVLVRLLPLRWGLHLSEFDPHFQYRLAKDMVENGFFAWTSWRDTMAWYPYGRNMTYVYPGLPATSAIFYLIVRALGLALPPMVTSNPLTVDPLFNFCVIFPVIMGALTCIVIYFLGKDIGGKAVGLFSAFFLALNSSYIGRTSLGFFDDESVGIFGILLFVLLFLRSIEPERSLRTGLAYAVSAGLALGYLFASWGAARYPLGIAVLFVFVLLLIRRYSSRLLLSYGATFAVALLIAINVPMLGFRFLLDPTVLAVVGVFLLLGVYEILGYLETPRVKALFVLGFFASVIAVYFILSRLGYIPALETKFISVLNPFSRFGQGAVHELIQSVAEHRPAAWGSFYYDVGVGAFFIPIGLFFAVQNPTNRNIFLCIFGLTSMYFAGSMVRLTLIMAPAFCLLWALALVYLLRPFTTILREPSVVSRRTRRLRARVGKEFSGAFIILLFLLLTFTFVLPTPGAVFPRVLATAYSPTTLAAGSMPLKPLDPVSDWIDALNWMRVNLQPSDVVASWWDYGYWITTIANKTTLADNGTVNATQIGLIGRMFVSNETEAIAILEDFGASYVVVFTTFTEDGSDVGWGDDGKWRWMARIAGLNDNSYGNYSLGIDWVDINGNNRPEQGELVPNVNGTSSVLYKLMRYGREVTIYGYPITELEHFTGPPEGYFSQKTGSVRSYANVIPLVCVYKIKYD